MALSSWSSHVSSLSLGCRTFENEDTGQLPFEFQFLCERVHGCPPHTAVGSFQHSQIRNTLHTKALASPKGGHIHTLLPEGTRKCLKGF